MREYSKMFRQMFQFDGRTRRREYWVCTLINATITCVLYAMMFFAATAAKNPLFAKSGYSVNMDTKESMVATLFVVLIVFVQLFFFIAMLGMKVRRFHDAGLPGWVYPICLVGIVLCGLGGLAELIICLLPSKEDNQYGENPKKSELNEYSGGATIAVVLILFFLVDILVGIAAGANMIVCGYRADDVNVTTSTDSDDDTNDIDIDTSDDYLDNIDIDNDATGDTTESDLSDSDDSESSNQIADGSEVPSDSQVFHLKVGNANLNLTFDPGATVEADDFSIKLTRTYDNGMHFNIEYADSYYGKDELDSLYCFDLYDGLPGYTKLDSAEKKKMDDGYSYISYFIYKGPTGEIIANATIWEYVGADTFMEIRVETDATDDINKIIDGAYVSFN